VLVVFGIWLVWTVTEVWVTAPRWAWLGGAAALGIAAQLVLDTGRWWLGIGYGGAAAFLALAADLLLVVTDLCKVRVLRDNPRR